MRRIFSLFLLSSILLGCSKDSDQLISIKGITQRDEGGNIMGNIDNTDWTNDSELPEKVIDFLNFNKTIDYTTAEVASLQILGYPNPFETTFRLEISCSKQTVCRFVIVDESLKVYLVNEMMLAVGGNSLALSGSSFPKNKNLRIYYAFYDSSETMYYKGHGDIRRK